MPHTRLVHTRVTATTKISFLLITPPVVAALGLRTADDNRTMTTGTHPCLRRGCSYPNPSVGQCPLVVWFLHRGGSLEGTMHNAARSRGVSRSARAKDG
jgi:hypothetical protein